MKRKIIIGLVSLGITGGLALYSVNDSKCCATCTGSSNCSACKNCKYCKHCAKDGGTCGVCKK